MVLICSVDVMGSAESILRINVLTKGKRVNKEPKKDNGNKRMEKECALETFKK